jgi:3-phenylpropionate/cinnamic acid dioxygenase small subunit
MAIDQAAAGVDIAPIPSVALEVDVATHHEVTQFLHLEARLLDERRHHEWLRLFADDIRYWMPCRYNRLAREIDKEVAAPGEVANFDEDKQSLGQRVFRLSTGMAWAEDPPSRTRHLVTNVWARPTDTTDELDVQSYFLTYRNRGDTEFDIWAGRRDDVLRRVAERTWQIARRTILLDQATILSKNLSVFF